MLYYFTKYSIIGNMYRERKKKWRTIRLVITEIIMVVAVIVTVVLLTFFAMGYRFSEDGEVGQQGLIQIQSIPTGATITIDDDTLLAHTNASKLVSAGEHTVKLTKVGYDSWSKTITSEVGRVIKLLYPRLFLEERTPEVMREFERQLSFFSPATNHDAVLYSLDNNPKWILLDVRGDDAIQQEIDLTEALKGLLVQNVTWNGNSDKVLVKASNDSGTEWLVVNLSDPENVVSINKEFDMNFIDVTFMNDAGDKLIALQDDAKLRTIDLSSKTISGVLATNVKSYSFYNDKIFYQTKENVIELWQENSDDVVVASYDDKQQVKFIASGYLDNKYIAIFVDGKCAVYEGDFPDAERSLSDMTLVYHKEIGFSAEEIISAADGELIVARAGKKLAVFDGELDKMSQFELPGEQMFFLDKYLIGTILDGNLMVMDFDGENTRTLTKASGIAFITKNNKWLYYLNSVDGVTRLYREKIIG